ncbi:MAG: hypothetical protein HYW25_04930 [Candidatus Aenigmarchaeota archaeon]|nr:hypothetical protein [Candidatus Aenigmarchaeota archaeon]
MMNDELLNPYVGSFDLEGLRRGSERTEWNDARPFYFLDDGFNPHINGRPYPVED